jgi:hypothetical protein
VRRLVREGLLTIATEPVRDNSVRDGGAIRRPAAPEPEWQAVEMEQEVQGVSP